MIVLVLDGKVSTTQFNAPAGGTFQAISLAGGHVVSINDVFSREHHVTLYTVFLCGYWRLDTLVIIIYHHISDA